MRKTIFIIAALFAATFANAQITLEHTFNNASIYKLPNYDGKASTLGDIMWWESNGDTYVADANTYATIQLPKIPNVSVDYVIKGYFTSDSRVCFIAYYRNEQLVGTNEATHLYIYDENGTMIQDLGTGKYLSYGFFQLKSGEYKFYIRRTFVDNTENTEIYSLPSNGSSQAVSTPSSPKRNARKIAREGQVLVETENNTYTLQGQEVK